MSDVWYYIYFAALVAVFAYLLSDYNDNIDPQP
jgi:hypothetical protein